MRVKDWFTKNLGLKMLSLVSAICIWMVVVNMNDPVTARRFTNVAVRLTNTEVVTGSGRVYTVLENTDTIPVVTVTGQRSVVDSMQSSDIIATADFNDMTSSGSIAISLSSSRYASRLESIKGSIENVKVDVEDVKNIQLVLQAVTTGTPAEGYIIGDVSMDENLIRVSGPQSVVDQISNAGVTVDVSGASGNLTTIADVVLTDAEGLTISNSQLKRNIDSVRVKISILGTKSLPVNVSYTGNPAEGYLVIGNASASPSSVKVAGDAASIRNASAITIPPGDLDISGKNTSITKTFDIRSYLPEGLRLADPAASTEVRVSVSIEEEQTKEIRIPVSRLTIINVPEDLVARFYEARNEDGELISVRMTIAGPVEAISQINNQNAVGYVDLEAFLEENGLETLPAAIYSMPVNIYAQEGVRITQKAEVNVGVQPRATMEESTEGNEGSSEQGNTDQSEGQSENPAEAAVINGTAAE